MRHAGYYALLQYSPVPERQEFLNFGILLVVPSLDFSEVAIANGSSRMERIFDGISKSRFEDEKRGFGNRVKIEYARKRSLSSLNELGQKLANDFRLSELRPAIRAMAQRAVERFAARLVAHRPAEASTLQAHLTLLSAYRRRFHKGNHINIAQLL